MPPAAPIRITVNGEDRDVPPGTTVFDLLRTIGVRTDVAAAVEINRTVVPRAAFEARALAERDRVEIVTLVGGG
jgi:sulfur carrier protein